MYCRVFLILFLIFFKSYSIAQSNKSELNVKVLFGDQELELGRNYYMEEWADSVKFEKIQFYITKLEIHSDSGLKRLENAQLVDLDNAESMHIILDQKIAIRQLVFNLGVDSMTSVSGAFGGDLDPTKGMYWSWQSGYINVKIEGKSEKFQTRNNVFQYHLGGYDGAFNSCQKVHLSINNQANPIVWIDLKQFLKHLDAGNLSSVMSPSLEAVQLSKSLANSFKTIQK